MGPDFYRQAFARNLGIIGDAEQEVLRGARVAVLGLGGVGGVHAATLARVGIGAFSLADPDTFETANLNRQYGAAIATLGRNKTDVMSERVRDINPEADVRGFADGVNAGNVDRFLEGADLLVDGIDFFAIELRRLVYRRARELGMPVVTSGPIGFGATLHVFLPGAMSFDEYFGLRDGMPVVEMLAAFAVGVAPSGWHLRYMDLSRVDFENQRAPGLGSACALCAALVATEAMKLLLKRGSVRPAPHYLQFDPYVQRFKAGYVPLGGRNPLQRLKRWLVLRKLKSMRRA